MTPLKGKGQVVTQEPALPASVGRYRRVKKTTTQIPAQICLCVLFSLRLHNRLSFGQKLCDSEQRLNLLQVAVSQREGIFAVDDDNGSHLSSEVPLPGLMLRTQHMFSFKPFNTSMT